MSRLKRIYIFARKLAFAAPFTIAFSAAAQSSGPSNINISGGLFTATGAAITSSSVSFKIDIYDKTGTCLLYTENHPSQDLSQTKGGFSLAVGKGSNPQNLIDAGNPAVMTSKVYENVGAIAGGWAGCTSGATLADGDERMIRVTYDLGAGPVVMTPDVPMASAAYAIVAETLQGKRPSDFLQVHDDVATDLSQANLENIFSASNYTKLNALVNGSSSQYMVTSPGAAVDFNSQRITGVATPSAATDAATKGYTDGSIGGKTADVSGVGPAVGDGYTLIWDQAGQKWTTGTPTAIDNTKLPLAGGTMTGVLNMGGFNFLNTGHITMAPLKTLTFGTLDTAQETTLIAGLLPANAGASWYNSQTKIFKIWDGTAAIAQVYSVNGKTGGAITLNANDLGLGTAALENVGTGVGNVPQLDAGGKIPAALLPSTSWSDIVNAGGSYMNYMPNNVACADGKVLKYDLTNTRWICGNDNDSFSGSTAGGDLAGTYPNPTIAANAVVTAKINDAAITTPKIFANPGVNRLVATDGSSGAALVPFECTGLQIMQWSGTGWSCQNVSAILPANLIADGGNARGADLSIGSNDTFALNFRTNNTNKMTIDSSGNVGVGTTNPARLLHVNGPIRIAPAALPGSPAAGDLAFDSGSGNAMKYYDGSAWVSIGSGTGDFLKNGSIAMTGGLQMGTQNITGVGPNITGTGALQVGSTGANSLTLASTNTTANAINLAVSGVNGGITLAPNGTGVVTSARPMVITPSTVPGSVAGTIFFDSAASNAMKYYDGSAWIALGAGTGDFLRNGSVAMTGALQMGTQNITGVGTNITGTGALQVGSTGANSLTLASTNTTASAINLAVSGVNGGITLAPNGTGVVTASRPMVITPSTVPASTAGTIFFDSAASNAMKYFDGTAWVSIGSGTGDFLKNGSIAMTGNFDAGTNNLNNVGAINGSGALAVSQLSGSAMTVGNAGGASSVAVQSGTGNATVSGAGTSTLSSSKVAAGATVVSSTGGTTATTLITSNGTGANAVNITSTGANSGITLAPNGTGVVTASRPMVITPSTVPGSVAGTIFFDSAASNAMKYYDGSAWIALGAGTGDFLKNGSIAMTGALQMGTQNITGVGTNITGTGALQVGSTGANSLTLASTNTTASAINLAVSGVNGGITLAPNGTGVVTSARPLTITPSTVPASNAGTIFFDSAASNAMKYFDGTAWVSVGAGTGDFLKNGSIAMTGALQMATQNITGVGTNITSAGALTIGNTGANSLSLSSNGTNATAVNIAVAGTNGGITLAPNGTGVVTSARPMVITPSTVPASTAGTIYFDSGAGNAMKYYDGSAWQTLGTGTGSGDFMKNGSVAMTGNFDAGTNNVNNVGAINGSGALAVSQLSGSAMTLGNSGGASSITLQSGTGNATVSGAGTSTLSSSKVAAGATVVSSTGGTTATTLITSNGTGANAINITSTGANSGITLAPNGTGVVTSARPMVITPSTVPASTAGTIFFDSAASNAMKYFDGTAWVSIGSGTGDFLKNGSIAMTGALQMGTQNITGVGTNITGTGALQVGSTGANSLTLASTNTTASAINLAVSGVNGGITLAPNGTGVITSSRPMVITPSTVPASTAGTIYFDSGAGNAMKYFDGTAWQTLGTGTGSGDFMKNGSVAMTGNFDAGTNNVNNVGAINGSGALAVSQLSGSAMTVGNSGGASSVTIQSGTGNATVSGAGTSTLSSSKVAAGATVVSSTGGTTATTLITSNGTSASAVNITSTGANSGITLAPNGTGVVTSSRPITITPSTVPTSTTGTIFFDSAASNAMKYYDGSAWQTVGTGTGSGDFMKNGSVAMTGNFNAGGNSILGNTTASANLTLESTSNASKGDVYIQPNGGKVGIGTTTVPYTLNVLDGMGVRRSAGYAHLTLMRNNGTDSSQTAVANTDVVGMIALHGRDPSGNFEQGAAIEGIVNGAVATNSVPIDIRFRTGVTGGGTEKMRITNTGNVGIGSANPSRLLDVAGPIHIAPAALPSSPVAGELAFDSGSANALKYHNGSAWIALGSGTGDFFKNGSVAMTGDFDAGGNRVLGNSTASANLELESTSNVTKGYVLLQKNGGNVGIGTTAPLGNLHVQAAAGQFGVIRMYGDTAQQQAVALGTSATDRWSMIHDGINSLTFYEDHTGDGGTAGGRMIILPGGNVGVGSSTPTRLLDVAGPIHIAPAALPSSPVAGELAFDSGSANALKYHNGSAWVSLGSGTGDFLKNGSVAMTGNFDAGTNNLNNIGAINGAAALAVSQSSGSALTLGNSGGASSATLQSGTGNATVSGAGVSTLTSSKVAAGATVVSSTGGTTATTLITSNGTSAAAVNITSTGANSGITLAPNGTGVVTSSRPLVISPSTVPASTTGTIFFDSAASNAMKYFDGSAWVSVGSGTGDFLKNGSVAMTGDFNAGGNRVLGNTTASANLELESTSNGAKGNVLLQKNGGSVGVGTTAPTASSILDLTSTTKGFLPPRMTTVQRTGISTPAAGLTVYDTDESALYIYANSQWTKVGAAATNFIATRNGVDQSIPSATWTTVDWTTAPVDSSGAMNLSTNRFSPTQAGYYMVSAGAYFSTFTASNTAYLCVKKNGASTACDLRTVYGTNETIVLRASTMVYLNGTPSDYMTVEVFQSTGGAFALNGSPTYTYLQGYAINSGSLAAGGGADNLGNHTATQNILLGGNWISSDGDPEGLRVDAAGNVGVGTTTPARLLHVNGPMRITPAALPSSPAAGELAFDSGAANALKYHDGSAWISIGSGTGDFMKNGSVAMTGNFDAGTNNINNVGTINGAAGLAVSQSSGSALTLGNSGGASSAVLQSGTGNVTVTGAGVSTLNSSKVAVGATVVSSTGGTTATTLITSNGTSAAAVNITSTGANSGITLAPNGTGVVTSSRPVVITPSTVPTSTAGTIFFDSAASNAMKYFDGTAWQTVGTGTGSGDFLKNGTIAMTGDFNAGGNRVLGNSTASANLELESTSNATKGYLLLQKNGGNVGIGTATPAQKLSVAGVIESTTGGVKFPDGTTQTTASTVGSGAYFQAVDEKAAANGGSPPSTSTWFTRTLNTVKTSATFASVSSNQITLSAGTYQIRASCPGHNVGQYLCRLQNITDGTTALAGTSEYTANGSSNTNSRSWITGQITVTGTKVFEVQMYVTVLQAGNGLGVGVGSGNETYTALEIWNGTGSAGGFSNQWDTAASDVYRTAGNVGIGTASPARLLHVNGPMRITPAALPSSPAAGELAFDSGASNALKYYNGSAWVSAGGGAASAGGADTQVQYNSSGALTGSSNYTFATSASGTDLNVAGRYATLAVTTNSSNSNSRATLSTNSDTAFMRMVTTRSTYGTSDGYDYLASANTLEGQGHVWLRSSNQETRIGVKDTGTGFTPAITTLQTGFVGVGTATPARILHVEGPMRITPAALPSSPAAGELAFDSGASNALKYYNGSAWVSAGGGTGDFLKNGTIAMTGDFNAGGNRVLGNSTASANLELESTSNGTKGYVLLQKNGGNVGIGTTAPGQLLAVSSTDSAATTPDSSFSTSRIALFNPSTTANTFSTLSFGHGSGASAGAGSAIVSEQVSNATGETQMRLGTRNSASAYGTRVLITGNGSVGIGTTSPTHNLTVFGNSASTMTNAMIYNDNTTNGKTQLLVGNNGAGHVNLIANRDNSTYLGVPQNTVGVVADYTPLVFATGTSNTASERMRIDSSGNVGIGTTTPSRALDVNGDIGTSGQNQIFTRYTPGADTHASSLGWDSLQLGNNGPNYIVAGHSLAGGKLGFIVNNTSRYKYAGTAINGTEAMSILSSGYVGIGTTNPGAKLTIQGTSGSSGEFLKIQDTAGNYRALYLTAGNSTLGFHNGSNIAVLDTAGTWVNASDVRLKKNITDIPYGLETVMRLHPVHYNMKSDGIPQVGFIAQEMRTQVPEVVTETDKSFLGISYGNLVAVLTKAIQELHDRWFADSAELHREIASVKTRADELAKENAELKARLDQQAKDIEAIKRKLGN